MISGEAARNRNKFGKVCLGFGYRISWSEPPAEVCDF